MCCPAKVKISGGVYTFFISILLRVSSIETEMSPHNCAKYSVPFPRFERTFPKKLFRCNYSNPNSSPPPVLLALMNFHLSQSSGNDVSCHLPGEVCKIFLKNMKIPLGNSFRGDGYTRLSVGDITGNRVRAARRGTGRSDLM